MAGYVTQDTLRLVLIGLVSVAAISVGAATINTWDQVGDAGGTQPDIPVRGNNTQGSGGPVTNDSGAYDAGGNGTMGMSQDLTWCAPFLPSTPGMLVYFGAFAGLVVLLKRRYSLGVAVFAMYGLAPIVLTAYFLSTNCASANGKNSGRGPVSSTLSDVATTELAQPNVSPVWLVAVLGVVLVATAAVILRSTSDQEIDPIEEEGEAETDAPDVADLAAAAGAAADRLEKHNADVDNEVYRAWWEMTSLLDVPNPHSSTPGEFAEAAVEVGMGQRHVDELTRLFEEVRYGKRDPESREERAIEIFRAIEEEYGRDGTTRFEDETDNTDGEPDTEENDGS